MRVIGLAGWSGAGKTTLLVRLLPLLSARELRVSTLKHAHHSFDIDRPGKDSHAHREAGAVEVLVASGKRWALMHELRDAPEPSLAELLGHLSPVDLVIVEGFKHAPHPKIEVHRAANGKPWLHPDDPAVIGLVTDAPYAGDLPNASLDDGIAAADLVAGLARPLPEVLAALGRSA